MARRARKGPSKFAVALVAVGAAVFTFDAGGLREPAGQAAYFNAIEWAMQPLIESFQQNTQDQFDEAGKRAAESAPPSAPALEAPG